MPSAWPSDSTIWLGRRQHPHAAHGRHHQVFGGCGRWRVVVRGEEDWCFDVWIYSFYFWGKGHEQHWTTRENTEFSMNPFQTTIFHDGSRTLGQQNPGWPAPLSRSQISSQFWLTFSMRFRKSLPTVSERTLKNAAWKCYPIQHAVETGLVSCFTYPQHILVGFREKVIGPIGMKSYMNTSSENQLFIDWPWLCSFKQIKIQESWWCQGA